MATLVVTVGELEMLLAWRRVKAIDPGRAGRVLAVSSSCVPGFRSGDDAAPNLLTRFAAGANQAPCPNEIATRDEFSHD